jgi:FkbM family methyltransferase
VAKFDFAGRSLRSANRLLANLGIRLQRTTKHRSLLDFLASRQVNLVLDVGANEGQFGNWLRDEGYKGEIWSFEPVHQAFAILSANAARRPPWKAYNMGLSDRTEAAQINVSKYSVFSSLHDINSSALSFNEEAAVISREEIDLQRLDDFLPNQNLDGAFLKIDTQGHEKQVLLGADTRLTQLSGILMELPIRHLYQGVWQLEEAIAFMRARGFSVSNLTPTNFDDAEDLVSLLEIDCIFKNDRR